MNELCPRKDWLFFGCHFEARYDRRTTPPNPEIVKMMIANGSSELRISGGEERIYVGDVCTRCGRWSKREDKS